MSVHTLYNNDKLGEKIMMRLLGFTKRSPTQKNEDCLPHYDDRESYT
jgi:hypothetical protein